MGKLSFVFGAIVLASVALTSGMAVRPAGAVESPQPTTPAQPAPGQPLFTNPAPAPTVTTWSPIQQVDRGLITIQGQGFDPPNVRVTLNGTNLELVEKSATRVVAKLGNWSSSSTLSQGVLAIRHLGSEVRVLADHFNVLPRWPTTVPHSTSVTRDSRSTTLRGLFDAKPYDIRIVDMPGDEVVGYEAVNSTSGVCAFVMLADGVQLYGSSNGRGAPTTADPIALGGIPGPRELHFSRVWLYTAEPYNGSNCSVVIARLLVRYADEPNDVHKIDAQLLNVPSPSASRYLRVTDTHALLTDSRLFKLDWSALNTPVVCKWESASGKFRVALSDIPVGSDCETVVWINANAFKPGWEVRRMGWSGPDPVNVQAGDKAPRCEMKDSDSKFSRMKFFIGWRAEDEDWPPQDGIRTILMRCWGLAQNVKDAPTSVKSTLDYVDFLAPIDATDWRQAQ